MSAYTSPYLLQLTEGKNNRAQYVSVYKFLKDKHARRTIYMQVFKSNTYIEHRKSYMQSQQEFL